MIFVTVGTHEQQFNRLVEYMDKWASQHDEEVIIQTGYSTYKPKVATWSNLFPYSEMVKRVDEARVVISLNDDPLVWCQAIVDAECWNRQEAAIHANEKITKSGFNIKREAYKLKEIYK